MKYVKFTIKNYKGIKNDLVIDMSQIQQSNIFTLVGLNESGKTSILEAINAFQNQIPNEKAHELIHKSRKSDFTDLITITGEVELSDNEINELKNVCKKEYNFNIESFNQRIEIEKRYSFKNSKFDGYSVIWTGNILGKNTKGKVLKSVQELNIDAWNKITSSIQSKLPQILYYENFLFDFPQRIYLSKFEGETKEILEYRNVLQDILDSFGKNLSIETHLLSRLNSNADEDKEALEAMLSDISAKLTEVIFSGWEEIFSKSNKEVELAKGKDEQKGWYIEIKIKQGKDRFYIYERSLGFRWFFSFLLFTEFRKERKADSGETLFLLDEPASNLHQKSQHKLLSIFERISNSCKIIYSTHSHHLISPKYLSGTFIVKNDAINYDNLDDFNQNETSIVASLYKTFRSNFPDQEDHFKPILDTIDYEPGELELDKSIIFLEGRNDYYTFKYVSNCLSLNTLYFYPGASVCKYDDKFRLFLAWNINFLALFDSDSQGLKEKKRYIKEISKELENMVFTYEDIDSKWINIQTEDLFCEVDKMKIINSLFPDAKKYEKSKFNTAIESLYIKDFHIDLETDSISKIKKVFEFINKKIK